MGSAGGAMGRVKFPVAVCAGEPESVTLKLSGVAVTWVVGVPLIKPVGAFSDNPAGRVPAGNCQVEAPVPPEAASGRGYDTFTPPVGSGAGGMVRFAGEGGLVR